MYKEISYSTSRKLTLNNLCFGVSSSGILLIYFPNPNLTMKIIYGDDFEVR